MFTLNLRNKNLVFIGSGSELIKATFEQNNLKGNYLGNPNKLVVDASSITGDEANELIKLHAAHGNNALLVISNYAQANDKLEPLLLVAKSLGIEVEESVVVSNESIVNKFKEINKLELIESFDEDDNVAFYKYPVGSPLSFLFVCKDINFLDSAILEYSNLTATINRMPHLFYLPEGSLDSKVEDYLEEQVDAQGGLLIREFEDVFTDVSTEGIKEVFKSIIDFFTPLPKDHVKKTTKQAKKVAKYLLHRKDFRPILDFLDIYFDNPEWMAKQVYRTQKLKPNYVEAYLATNGKFDILELDKNIGKHKKDYNKLVREFHKYTSEYLRALNELFDKFRLSINLNAIAKEASEKVMKDGGTGSKIVDTLTVVLSNLDIASTLLLGQINKLNKPITNIDLSKYTVVGYDTRNGYGKFGNFEKDKYVIDPLKPEQFKLAISAIRELADFDAEYYDFNDYNIRTFNYSETDVLLKTPNGQKLVTIYSDYGFYYSSGYVYFPAVTDINYRVVIGLITWMYESLDILEPRSVK